MLLKCPRCPTSPPLEDSDLRSVHVHVCKTCRSILMTRRDLDAMLASVGRSAQKKLASDVPSYFHRVRQAAHFVAEECSIHCPACRYNMYEVKSRDIIVDFCLNCQSIWFDEGELNAALAEARKHGAMDLIPTNIDSHDTASLICFMLETITSGPNTT